MGHCCTATDKVNKPARGSLPEKATKKDKAAYSDSTEEKFYGFASKLEADSHGLVKKIPDEELAYVALRHEKLQGKKSDMLKGLSPIEKSRLDNEDMKEKLPSL